MVLAETADRSGSWAVAGLRAAGLSPVELVTADQLGAARRWEHRVGHRRPSFDILLPDGRSIHSGDIQGTLNRLTAPPAAQLARLAPADRDYGANELFALYTSCLTALPGPVLNPPSALGLSGRVRAISEWAALAAAAGLPILPLRLTSDEPLPSPAPVEGAQASAMVVANRVIAPPALSSAVLEGCRRLAELAKMPLLGIELRPVRGSWTFATADPTPDLTAGGQELLEALASALTGEDPS